MAFTTRSANRNRALPDWSVDPSVSSREGAQACRFPRCRCRAADRQGLRGTSWVTPETAGPGFHRRHSVRAHLGAPESGRNRSHGAGRHRNGSPGHSTTLPKDLGLRPVGAGVVIVRDGDATAGCRRDVEATATALAHHSGAHLRGSRTAHRECGDPSAVASADPRHIQEVPGLAVPWESAWPAMHDDWQVALLGSSAPSSSFLCAWAEQGIWRGPSSGSAVSVLFFCWARWPSQLCCSAALVIARAPLTAGDGKMGMCRRIQAGRRMVQMGDDSRDPSLASSQGLSQFQFDGDQFVAMGADTNGAAGLPSGSSRS